MKTLYKSLFFGVAMVLGMTACDNNDELPPTGPLDNAEKLVAGTYVGEWTRETDGTDEVITGAGSITFSVDSENYGNNVSVMTLNSDIVDLGVTVPLKTVCNITLLSSGEFTYWNQTSSNPLGVVFYGKVSTSGVATINFSKTVRDGRKEVKYIYSFSGSKQ